MNPCAFPYQPNDESFSKRQQEQQRIDAEIKAALNEFEDRPERRVAIERLLACVRSRTDWIVGLVVPTSLQICASEISGWFLMIQAIASGLSVRLDTGVYFGPLARTLTEGRSVRARRIFIL